MPSGRTGTCRDISCSFQTLMESDVFCPDDVGVGHSPGATRWGGVSGTGRLRLGDVHRRSALWQAAGYLCCALARCINGLNRNRNARTANQIVFGLRCMISPLCFSALRLVSVVLRRRKRASRRNSHVLQFVQQRTIADVKRARRFLAIPIICV